MIITIILAVGLIGTLGFVFWQNFMQPKSNASTTVSATKKSTPSSSTVKSTGTSTVYNTYKDSKYNFTFQYPNTWSVTTNTNYGADFSTIKDESVVLLQSLQ